MHRLVIVSGPNRGSSYSLIEGENSIGRQMDNHIVLTSGKVSKRHCSMLVTNKDVFLRDEGSTNGTFVNGSMIRKIPLKAGDKVGVGEFVLELVSASTSTSTSTLPVQASSFVSPAMLTDPLQEQVFASPSAAVSAAPAVTLQEPEDLPGKLEFLFEHKFMPQIYGMLMKSQYRSIVLGLLALLSAVTVMGALIPIQDLAEKSIQSEAQLRARIIAKEMVDRYSPALANRAESQIDLSFLDKDDTVRMAVILDPNLQIIAPQARMGQLLGSGVEARLATLMVKAFKDGQERGTGTVGNSLAVYIEPIRIVDPRLLKTQFAGMAVVSIDFSHNMLESDELGVVYGLAITIAGLMMGLIYFILIRLSMKPFEVLNDDLDRVLRGELPKVTHEFKIEELDPLWSNINATVQRVSKDGGGGSGDGDRMVNWDQELGAFRALSDASGFGFIGFDPVLNAVSINPMFEEISGIRSDAIGQNIQQLARDQSMISLTRDVFERVQGSPNRTAMDDFEFSGVAYQVIGCGVGPMDQTGMAMIFKRKD
jgi:hypothetical protein